MRKVSSHRKSVLVGQLVDAANNNPQVLNTRALLSRFSNNVEWIVPHYYRPDPMVADSISTRLCPLGGGRFWTLDKARFYQRKADAIFYPGVHWFDELGLRLREVCGRRVPLIATLEGFVGDRAREGVLSEIAGHAVYCQRISPEKLKISDRIIRRADHVIAISPFIAKLGRAVFGDKFSVIPLGIDTNVFNCRGRSAVRAGFTVAGAGRLYDNKRPQLFVRLAERFSDARFVWYGEGELRPALEREVNRRGLKNISFPGPLPNHELADAFRRADLFVLPSLSEGVPKVSQEAAACGLPVVLFAFYEAPSVVHGKTGYCVVDDEEFELRVAELVNDPEKARLMGRQGAQLAMAWDWRSVAPQWEQKILEAVDEGRSG